MHQPWTKAPPAASCLRQGFCLNNTESRTNDPRTVSAAHSQRPVPRQPLRADRHRLYHGVRHTPPHQFRPWRCLHAGGLYRLLRHRAPPPSLVGSPRPGDTLHLPFRHRPRESRLQAPSRLSQDFDHDQRHRRFLSHREPGRPSLRRKAQGRGSARAPGQSPVLRIRLHRGGEPRDPRIHLHPPRDPALDRQQDEDGHGDARRFHGCRSGPPHGHRRQRPSAESSGRSSIPSSIPSWA